MFQDMPQEGGDRGSLKKEFLRLKGEEEISDIYVSDSRHSWRLLVKGGVTVRKTFSDCWCVTLIPPRNSFLPPSGRRKIIKTVV